MTEELRQLSPPWFHSFIGSDSDLTNFAWSVASSGGKDLAVRTVRGMKMPTTDRLFDEFAAALQFPDYFGENWAAFDECLSDLEWLPAAGYVLVVRHATFLLSHEDAAQLSTFINILVKNAEEWSKPIAMGESWDRCGKPFHVVLHTLTRDPAPLFNTIYSDGQPIREIL